MSRTVVAAALMCIGFHLQASAETPQNPPTFVVNTTADHDDGVCGRDDCTLREAVAVANADVTAELVEIRFAADVRGTITIQNGTINLTRRDTYILGPGAGALTLNGGGLSRIFNVSGDQNCKIAGLRLENGSVTGVGGALLLFGRLEIENCVFANNRATSAGAAVYIEQTGRAEIRKTVFTGNSGSGNFAFTTGGAIASRGSVELNDCTLIDNAAGLAGGAIAIFDSLLEVERCTFSGNTALLGGAIRITASSNSAPVQLINSTFSGNESEGTGNAGGALSNAASNGYTSQVVIVNCTFSGNAADNGGAIHNQRNDTANANLFLVNTILRTGARGPNITNSNGTIQSGGHNISNDTAGGGSGSQPGGFLNATNDKRNTDPKLDPDGLDENGGYTPTIALLAESPAVDAANPNAAPAFDQRLFVRSGAADIGAFEFGGTLPVTLANISTRGRIGTDANVLIGGFIVTGAQPKRVMIRAIGPSLDISGKLADPQVQLLDGAGNPVAFNNNWQDAPNRQEIDDSTIAPEHPSESAILRMLEPGAYTAVMSGVNKDTGIGLVEAYDLDLTAGSKLANISTRGLVQTGNNVMIGGVIVVGSKLQKVLIRALGPSLKQSGVEGALADPTLRLFNSNGVQFGFNDNWKERQADIEATGIPPKHDLEAAIVTGLPPGSYTAVVAGNGSTTGVGLVEVYALE